MARSMCSLSTCSLSTCQGEHAASKVPLRLQEAPAAPALATLASPLRPGGVASWSRGVSMTWEALRAGRPAGREPTSPHCSRPLRVPFRPRGGLDEARDAAGGNEGLPLSAACHAVTGRGRSGERGVVSHQRFTTVRPGRQERRREEGVAGAGERAGSPRSGSTHEPAAPGSWRRRQTLRVVDHEGAWRSSGHADLPGSLPS
jgi:hypothetical protein